MGLRNRKSELLDRIQKSRVKRVIKIYQREISEIETEAKLLEKYNAKRR